ncbi:MRN complex-interacting protein-like [Actinia tenebrosa]|uniref:MRN complex-interacting protein-like n=1 Tax=Actinia tenebrosa TaxID=6105 RepID=A0A6P8IYM6_ACTTE|nr:MRN complex-interacting protein-like [Actinia tenebrosa]
MVQEFNVLKCFSCKRFQVHQVKKANKWICKVCGEKQSISRIYGQGSAPDCRKHVQKLNKIQGEREQLIAEKVIDANVEEFDCCDDEETDTEKLEQENFSNKRDQAGSRWQKFIETEIKNEENLEEEFWNGIPVTMNKKAFDDGTKQSKQPKKKITQSNEELLPQKKRVRTQDFENDEDEFQHRKYLPKRDSQKVKEMKEKSKSKWEIFNSSPEEIPCDEKIVPFDEHAGISTLKSKRFDVVNLNDSSAKNAPCNSQNVMSSKSINSQVNSKGNLCTNNTKASQSKWAKFLGSSECTQIEDEFEGEHVESYSKFGASENSIQNIQLLTKSVPTCNQTMDSKTLESICNISNAQCVESNEVRNSSGIQIPSFLMNAKATRSEQKAGESTDSCRSNQKQNPVTSKDLFTIDDDELGDEWWNV